MRSIAPHSREIFVRSTKVLPRHLNGRAAVDGSSSLTGGRPATEDLEKGIASDQENNVGGSGVDLGG